MGEKEKEIPPGKCVCGACGIILDCDDWPEHAKTEEHKKNAKETMEMWADKGRQAKKDFKKQEQEVKLLKRVVGNTDEENAT